MQRGHSKPATSSTGPGPWPTSVRRFSTMRRGSAGVQMSVEPYAGGQSGALGVCAGGGTDGAGCGDPHAHATRTIRSQARIGELVIADHVRVVAIERVGKRG